MGRKYIVVGHGNYFPSQFAVVPEGISVTCYGDGEAGLEYGPRTTIGEQLGGQLVDAMVDGGDGTCLNVSMIGCAGLENPSLQRQIAQEFPEWELLRPGVDLGAVMLCDDSNGLCPTPEGRMSPDGTPKAHQCGGLLTLDAEQIVFVSCSFIRSLWPEEDWVPTRDDMAVVDRHHGGLLTPDDECSYECVVSARGIAVGPVVETEYGAYVLAAGGGRCHLDVERGGEGDRYEFDLTVQGCPDAYRKSVAEDLQRIMQGAGRTYSLDWTRRRTVRLTPVLGGIDIVDGPRSSAKREAGVARLVSHWNGDAVSRDDVELLRAALGTKDFFRHFRGMMKVLERTSGGVPGGADEFAAWRAKFYEKNGIGAVSQEHLTLVCKSREVWDALHTVIALGLDSAQRARLAKQLAPR
ncbi:hypothetical protein [Streptomyces sp. WAC06614]|uniref:hypothetical protein n=1 Tax=Streptomyces sp. WAC06614 TaxID=2487416 RepID=UPI000F7AAA56|nr:hypothetical protein [Streptomyces sp. WAC06614]RSS65960.1 hypothetical protein EF918_29960 [Streptomyces sp. WAC06614]